MFGEIFSLKNILILGVIIGVITLGFSSINKDKELETKEKFEQNELKEMFKQTNENVKDINSKLNSLTELIKKDNNKNKETFTKKKVTKSKDKKLKKKEVEDNVESYKDYMLL